MVYESDFYTTRRPYGRPTVTSYSVTRREVDWSRHPTVARPSQVQLPALAFARRQPRDDAFASSTGGPGAGAAGAGECAVPRKPACLRHAAPRTHSRVLFEIPQHPIPDYRYAY